MAALPSSPSALRLQVPSVTPDGQTMSQRMIALFRIKSLQQRGVITATEAGTLKASIVNNNDIQTWLDALESCSSSDRAKVEGVMLTVPRPSALVSTNSFRALKPTMSFRVDESQAQAAFSAAVQQSKAAVAAAAGAGMPGSPTVASPLKLGSPPPLRSPATTPGSPFIAGVMSPKGSMTRTDSLHRIASIRAQAAAEATMQRIGSFSDLARSRLSGGPPPPSLGSPVGGMGSPVGGMGSPVGHDEVYKVDDLESLFLSSPRHGGRPASKSSPATAPVAAGPPVPPPRPPPGPPPVLSTVSVADLVAPYDAQADPARSTKGPKRLARLSFRSAIFVRSGLLLKGWKARFAILEDDMIRIYATEFDRQQGIPPEEELELEPNMTLSEVKAVEYEGSSIMYFSIGARDEDGREERMLKFGTDSHVLLEAWQQAIQDVIAEARNGVAYASELESQLHVFAAVHPRTPGSNSSDETGELTASAFQFNREGSAQLTDASGVAATTIPVMLLDDTRLPIVVTSTATVRDVCVGVKKRLGLNADGDFSLFLRDHETFTCLPERLSVEHLDALCTRSGRTIVYSRRICLSKDAAIEKEADEGEIQDSAARRLLFLEASFNVRRGYYIMPVDKLVKLAALQLLIDAPEKADKRTVLRKRFELIMSPLALVEYNADTLMDAVMTKFNALGSITRFDAQMQYVNICRELPEYGCRFFVGRMFRALRATRNSASRIIRPHPPMWLASSLETRGLDVLVALNRDGIMLRPDPPTHAAAEKVASPAAKAFKLVPWYLHEIGQIEVWGTKKTRPVFTYRVREFHTMVVGVYSAQYQEMAATLHMYVYQILAMQEGHAKSLDRTQGGIQRHSNPDHEAAPLPPGWLQFRDPETGEVCYWNSVTRETKWERPLPYAEAEDA